MPRQPVDLSAHINQTVEQGHPADFPVTLRPVLYENPAGELVSVPHRVAVIRTDLNRAISVVSDRYQLITHEEVLSTVQRAISLLDVGPVPRGVYVDRDGARMRALFKFPALMQDVTPGDAICPCLKLQNTYDGTGRISIHIGAFRFVCTNLAVGGGGVFAGGFMSVHVGEIALATAAEQLTSYLNGFERIVTLYRAWFNQRFEAPQLVEALPPLPQRTRTSLVQAIAGKSGDTVYAAYNAATWFATHQMRSPRAAFDLLEDLNRVFQTEFPVTAV